MGSGGGVRSLRGTGTHYDTLGIDAAASPQDIRRAYRNLARQLHPDRHQQSDPEQARTAARRMSEINAAWSVLSNPAAKELYDLELSLAVRTGAARPPSSPGRSGSSGAPGAPAPPPGHRPGGPGWSPAGAAGSAPYPGTTDGHPVIRGVLWLVLLGVLAAIFIFTAYAASDSNERPGGSGASRATTPALTVPRVSDGACVVELVGAIDLVDCAAPHDARVADVVPLGRPCPGGSREVYLPDQQEIACLGVG
jgi:DnaJ-domain-containing protein 1